MKQQNHQDRKSFKKWALPGQRRSAATTVDHVKRTSSQGGAFAGPVRGFSHRFHQWMRRRQVEAEAAKLTTQPETATA